MTGKSAEKMQLCNYAIMQININTFYQSNSRVRITNLVIFSQNSLWISPQLLLSFIVVGKNDEKLRLRQKKKEREKAFGYEIQYANDENGKGKFKTHFLFVYLSCIMWGEFFFGEEQEQGKQISILFFFVASFFLLDLSVDGGSMGNKDRDKRRRHQMRVLLGRESRVRNR